LLLPQFRDFTPQPAVLLLERFARHSGTRPALVLLLPSPRAELVRSNIELAPDLRQRHAERPTLRDQPYGFGFELGTECPPFTRPCWSRLPV
jgi:hypothetical protein